MLYPNNLKNWNLDGAKAPGLNDRKGVNINNIDPLAIAQSRELSRSSKSNSSGYLGIIDSHAHLTSFEEGDLPAILERAQKAHIEHIINICTNAEELKRGIELSLEYPWISNVAATTPHDVEQEGEANFEAIAKQTPHLVAIGETGLDYFYEHSNRELQQLFLRRYLRLAKEVNLPVVIHCREAFADFFKILDEEYDGPGVLHCFTGNEKEADEVIRRGWYLSLSGIVTFKKSEKLQEIAKRLPLERLLIETDAPYLAPVPYRGKQNEPAFLIETAKCIANLRGIALEELAAATKRNTQKLFKISPTCLKIGG